MKGKISELFKHECLFTVKVKDDYKRMFLIKKANELKSVVCKKLFFGLLVN